MDDNPPPVMHFNFPACRCHPPHLGGRVFHLASFGPPVYVTNCTHQEVESITYELTP